MERFNVIQDICESLGLEQIQNSWIKTLGDFLDIEELPGLDDYEQRVFTAAISNSAVVIPPATFITEDHGNLITTQTLGYKFTGNGVTLTSNPDNTIDVNIPGSGVTPLYHFLGVIDINYTTINWLSRIPGTTTLGPIINTFTYPPVLTRVSKGVVEVSFPGTGSPMNLYKTIINASFNNAPGNTIWPFMNYAENTTRSSVSLVTKIPSTTTVPHFDGYNTFQLQPADYTGFVTLEIIVYA